jgi:hypothetical protein
MVAWIPGQKRFYPNWEVERIIHIPLEELFIPANFVRFRLHLQVDSHSARSNSTRDFPSFRFQTNARTELLWGATYRITAAFLESVFQFRPPPIDDLPIVEGALDETYLSGHK